MKNLGRRILLATLLGVVVYAALALSSDVRALRATLGRFEGWTFAAALVLAFANYALRFVKWEYYLRRLRIGAKGLAPEGEPFEPLPVWESFVIYLAGFSMSITPGKAGEVFKSALLASARGVPVARSAPIVVADRVTDLLSLVLLVGVGSLSFPGYGWIALVALALVAGVLFFVMVPKVTLALIDLTARMGPLARLTPKLREAFGALRVVTTPGALVIATVISVIAWALECAGLWILQSGLHSPVSISLAFFAYATATIAGAIAMLPGGLGGTELTMRTILHGMGSVATPVAAASVLLVRLATLWFAVVLGFFALAVFRRGFDRHRDEAATPA